MTAESISALEEDTNIFMIPYIYQVHDDRSTIRHYSVRDIQLMYDLNELAFIFQQQRQRPDAQYSRPTLCMPTQICKNIQ